jgi:hypothetical protein
VRRRARAYARVHACCHSLSRSTDGQGLRLRRRSVHVWVRGVQTLWMQNMGATEDRRRLPRPLRVSKVVQARGCALRLLYVAAVQRLSHVGHDHLIRRVCRQCSRPGYIPCDLVGRHSLVRVISLSCAVLYGQIQASADQDHRLIPSMRTTGAYDDGPPSAARPRCLWWCMRAVLLAHEHQAPSAL